MQYFWVTFICFVCLVWFARSANVVQKTDGGPRRAIEKPEQPHESQKPAQAAQRRPKKVRPMTPVPTTTPTTTTTLSEVEIHARDLRWMFEGRSPSCSARICGPGDENPCSDLCRCSNYGEKRRRGRCFGVRSSHRDA